MTSWQEITAPEPFPDAVMGRYEDVGQGHRAFERYLHVPRHAAPSKVGAWLSTPIGLFTYGLVSLAGVAALVTVMYP